MMYMSSSCANDGSYNLTVTFHQGIDLNMAQVLVQNRVSLAIPKLPDVIKQTGVTTRKRSPDILMGIALTSPHGRYDQLYLSNYALRVVKDELARVEGVGDVFLFGERDYSMRIWVDPAKLAARNLTADDVVAAIREQNSAIASGTLGQQPVPHGQDLAITLDTLGRLKDVEQFEDIIVRTDSRGRVLRVKDVARVEFGAKNEDVSSRLDGQPTVFLAIFQLPDANALDTDARVQAKMKDLQRSFPEDVDWVIGFTTTPYTEESLREVVKTLRDAVILVALVVLLFLQNWRSAVIPLIAVPVAIVGTFAAMAALTGLGDLLKIPELQFSLNNLTLFGLVLAIGIVVDDAIVVVEAVEHHIEEGMAPREATIKAMGQVSGPVVAVGLVLSAVFVPCAFIGGITGLFFRQFALTISVSTLLSAFNSLTLSPALAALLLKPRDKGQAPPLPWLGYLVVGGVAGYLFGSPALTAGLGWLAERWPAAGPALEGPAWALPAAAALLGMAAGAVLGPPLNWALRWFFRAFNRGFRLTAGGYTRAVGGLLRVSAVVMLVYGGLLALTWGGFARTPRGFVPQQDMGYLMVSVQLPDAAATERTDAVMREMEEFVAKEPGILHSASIVGQSFALNATGSNFGSMFINLKPYSDRREPVRTEDGRMLDLSADSVVGRLMGGFSAIPGAMIVVFPPPPVRGVGRAGGFAFVVEDRGDLGPVRLQNETDNLIGVATAFGPFRLTAASFEKLRYDDKGRRLPGAAHLIGQTLGAQGVAPAVPPVGAMVQTLGSVQVADADAVALGPLPEAVLARLQPLKGIAFETQYQLREKVAEVLEPREQALFLNRVLEAAEREPGLARLFTAYRANVPQLHVQPDPSECETRGVKLADVNDTLVIYQGSLYVNDFNRFGRTWQVIVQSDAPFRTDPEQLYRLKVRSARGAMVPLGSLVDVKERNGPLVLMRYNMYPAATINGSAAPGVSSRQGIDIMERLADRELPPSMAYEWTEMSYLELQAGNTALSLFGYAVVAVFLVLAAQYESWSLPLAVILVVPLCLLGAVAGVNAARQDINVFTQIGFVVLVGLASKNAILIVEFAKQRREAGLSPRQAALEACRLRLRPIVMTSVAFILGVVPLLVSHGAGFEMRRTLGVAVFGGMIGVTLFGLFLTPVFFFVIDRIGRMPLLQSPAMRLVSNVVLGVLGLHFLRRRVRG
jgi:multidrug efflux pump subunit AcrB